MAHILPQYSLGSQLSIGPSWPDVERNVFNMNNDNTTAGQAPEEEATPVLRMKLDVSVRTIEPKGNLVGFASLKINDSFVIDDFKVLQSDKGIFVGMPSKPDKSSKTGYRDTARPITKEFRAGLTEAIATAYQAEIEKLQARAAAIPATEKPSIQKQLADGEKQAVKDNAVQPAPAKGKTKSEER